MPMSREKNKQKILFGAAIALVMAAFVFSVGVGKYPITIGDIWGIITGDPSISEMKRSVFFTLRLPRCMMGVMAGVGMGMAGCIFQTVFKNPLAVPDIIGVSNGANLGAACAIVLFGYSPFLTSVYAFIGALLALLFVMGLVKATRSTRTATYILAGIVAKATTEALIMVLKFYADPEKQLASIEFWSMGSFGNVTLNKLLAIFPVFFLALLGLVLLRRQIGLLGLNEDEARMLGLRLKSIRMFILVCCTLVVAAVISITGSIAFIGLIAPHIAKLMLKRNDFGTIAMSAFVGAFVLLVADCLARSLYSAELPISILTTAVGVPVLIYFMCKKRGVE